MRRNFHSAIWAAITRIGIMAGAALVITGSPFLSGNVFAAEPDAAVHHSMTTAHDRVPEAADRLASDIEERILPLITRVNGWQ
ncbi:hypothetical protein AB0H51_26315 [Streptomyces griseoluteus]|uniref:hypothetical protein n=1 Tax=Streptomyces griseoluteus TaxID=29306 RepID=UPI0033D4A29F